MPKPKDRLWNREELILAFNLYCKTPFGRIHAANPEIIALAKILGRTAASVTWKLSNFARLDPALQARGIKGASHGSKGEIEVWNEFNENWDALAFEGERLRAERLGQSVERLNGIDERDLPKEGKEKERIVKVRVNQRLFRSAVLAAYGNRCCITGLSVPTILSAGHIAPWSTDSKNRMNPRNGLCLSLVHHRAFDSGLIKITPDFRVRFSSTLLKLRDDPAVEDFFGKYEGQEMRRPNRFQPDATLLKLHSKLFVP
jgi:putative restriction endonuclease